MIKINAYISGDASPRDQEKIARALAAGLKDQVSRTPWALIVEGAEYFVKLTNEEK